MQHAITQRKERLTGVADGAKGLPHPVGHHFRVAARAKGLSRLVRILAELARRAGRRSGLQLGASGTARAKGLSRPIGYRSEVAARAKGLSGLVCELADAAIGARVGRVPPLARSLLTWAALDAFPEVVDPRNAAVTACWARSALRRVADFKDGSKLAGIAR